MLALRRMREAPLLRDRNKIAELMNLHRATLRRKKRFVEVRGPVPQNASRVFPCQRLSSAFS